MFKTLREETLALARDSLRQSAQIDQLIQNLGAAELETSRIQSPWEDPQNVLNCCSHAAGPTGVSTDGHTHTAGNTSRSTLQNFTVSSAVSSSAFGYSQLTAGGDPCAKKARSEFRRAGEAPSLLSAGGGPCAKQSQ